MKNNIPKFYILSFLFGLIFYYGIERLFLFSIGTSATDVSLISVLTALIILTMDVPLGSFADRIGRKNTFYFAISCLSIGTVIFALSQNWIHYAIGTIFYGLFLVGISGTSQAMVYDTLMSLGRAKEYSKIIGRTMATYFSGIGIAVFSSGFLAQNFGFRFNYWLSLATCLAAFLVIYTLIEPMQHKLHEQLSFREHMQTPIKTITYNNLLKNLAIIFPVLGLIMWISNNYSQFVFNDYKISLTLVSLNSTLALIAGVSGHLIAHKFEKRFYVLLALDLFLLAMIGLGPKLVVLVSLVAMFGVNSILLNNIDARIQHQLPSQLRATATSAFTALASVVTVSLGLIISFALKYFSIFVIFRYVFAFSLIVTIFWLIKSTLNKKPSDLSAVWDEK